MLLFLLQPPELRPLAHSCLLPYWDLLYRIPKQFNETIYCQFAIFKLAEGLLRYYAQNSVLADAGGKAAHEEFFLFRREGRGIHNVKPQGNPAAHLVNVIDCLIGDMGDKAVVREAPFALPFYLSRWVGSVTRCCQGQDLIH